jgi:hypothetical protein
MEAYRFEATIFENGMIQVPNFKKIKSRNVEVLLLFKTEIEQETKEKEVREFINKWFGYFPEIETEDIRYNAIIGKDK